jgi:hypothetical protein
MGMFRNDRKEKEGACHGNGWKRKKWDGTQKNKINERLSD